MERNDEWKKIQAFIITGFILSIYLSSLFSSTPVSASGSNAIRYMNSTGNIQDIINISEDGDTLQINESMSINDYIIINKSIILQGKNNTDITINCSYYGFNITVNNVNIHTLTLENCSTALNIRNQTNSLTNITIENITVINCSNHGISIFNATQIQFNRSIIMNCTNSGIYLYNTSNSDISNNSITQTRTALNITHNSNLNTIKNNTFYQNSYSINITSSNNNCIYNNRFFNCTILHAYDDASNNWNTTAYGNYWNDYTGTDGNNDSYGDIVHPINGGSNQDNKPLGYFLPIVNFSYQPCSPSTATTIEFTDNSTDPNNRNNPQLIYQWNFGDGNSSNSQNPTHNYEDDGEYTITLTVSNSYGQNNQTSIQIHTSNTGPNTSFTWSPDPGMVNETVTFTSICSDDDGSIEWYNWSYGDNSYLYSSSQTNPTHTYNQSGDYIVYLNTTDDDGNTSSYSDTVTITYTPSVNFSINPASPDTSDMITFTDNSIDSDGTIEAYNWSFGDERYSEAQNPTHSYDDDGAYTIRLTITDNDGATNQTSQTISVINTIPTANFSITPANTTSYKTLQTITFTNCSLDTDGYITNCTWSFGDGTYNYSMNTTAHQYTDNGTYCVTLNVTDDDGDTDEICVNISILNVGPSADFTYEPTIPEVWEIVWFNDTSSDQDGSITNWSWTFGDDSSNYSRNTTHSFSNLNSYDVTLTVKDDDSNSSSVTKHIIIKKTTTKTITSTDPEEYNVQEAADSNILIKTKSNTNFSVIQYSECPFGIDEAISGYKSVNIYVNITLEDESLLDWINLSIYYTQTDVGDEMDEDTLSLFYWNETNQQWTLIPNCNTNTIDSGGYSGFVQANITHLTLFTIAGKIIEEETTIPTLPTIINSSNNMTFTISTPTLHISYNDIVPKIQASLNGTTVPTLTTDNKNFSISINTDLSNGNYTVQLVLTNGSLSRTDTIQFSINIPTIVQTNNNAINIPIWIWYSIFGIFILILLWKVDIKTQLVKSISNRNQPVTTEETHSDNAIKHTFASLHDSFKHIDTLMFGVDDPWNQTKTDINQTMFNIALFTEKPDAYVGIQEQLISDEPHCKKILDLLVKNKGELKNIIEKTNLPKDELGHELSTLMKYGLITQKENSFQLTYQAKELIKEKKKG